MLDKKIIKIIVALTLFCRVALASEIETGKTEAADTVRMDIADKPSEEKPTEKKALEKAATSTRVSAKEMEERSDMDLADTLNMVPGMDISATITGGKKFVMRGFSQDKVAVLVDGIPRNEVYEGGIDITQIPMQNISHLIVNRGVSSALYGTYGTIGSINIVTKKPKKFFIESKVHYGEYNNYQVSASQGVPLGNFYYWITVSMENSGGFPVSGRLDREERRYWFDRIVRYDLYGKKFNDITLKAAQTYLNDTGTWDHSNGRKYHAAGKAGYEITNNTEAGISLYYFSQKKETSNFDPNCFSNYNASTGMWNDPVSGNSPDVPYETDGKDAVFQNQARVWPEYVSVSAAPYFKFKKNRFSIKGDIFINYNRNVLESYASTDHQAFMYPSSTYFWNSTANRAVPYSDNFFESIHTDVSYGIQAFPSFRISDSGKLNFSLIFRDDIHREEEGPFDYERAADIIDVHGKDGYETKLLGVRYATLASEYELSPVKNFTASAGISYDAQDVYEHKRRGTDEDNLNEYVDGYIIKDDSYIWGTRDSFNPVIGVIWQPLKGADKSLDEVVLRAAASAKTRFPTMKAYSRISDTTGDLGVKPERSYNGNTGFEFPVKKLRLRSDYFYSRFKDKIEQAFNEELGGNYYVNLEGVETQGVETIVKALLYSGKYIKSIDINFSHTYVHKKNLDNTPDERKNMGDEFELTPEHFFTADFRVRFVTETEISVFGKHIRNQFRYAMKTRPRTVEPEEYSTVYFEQVELHTPLMLNIRISQKIGKNFGVYVMCRNILDDYGIDPFNPGPGRMWFIGGKAGF